MAIKVTIEEQEEKKRPEFPWVGLHSSGLIVLFGKDKCGTVLDHGRSSHSVGKHSIDWAMSEFTPLKGTITISNA